MNWTPDRISEAERMYRTMPASAIAAHFGVSHDNMRAVFYRHGIKDPKAPNDEKDRELAIRFRRRYGWSVCDIAEQLGRSIRFVRRHLVGEPVQLDLFDEIHNPA